MTRLTSRARALVGLATAVIGVTTYCLTRSVLASAGDAPEDAVDPVRQVASEGFALDTEGRARFRPVADLHMPYDGSPRTLQVVTMLVYRGGLSVERVEALLAAGRAEALERRLGPGWDAILQRGVQEVDDMLQEVLLAMRDEEAGAVRAVEASGDDTWIIRSNDSGRAHVEQSMQAVLRPLAAKRQGKVVARGQGPTSTHFLLKRSRFPVYWEYDDQHVALVKERRQRAGIIVSSLYREHGMAVFAPREPEAAK